VLGAQRWGGARQLLRRRDDLVMVQVLQIHRVVRELDGVEVLEERLDDLLDASERNS
jgi:limonene-1,2-epoxide hydrolase